MDTDSHELIMTPKEGRKKGRKTPNENSPLQAAGYLISDQIATTAPPQTRPYATVDIHRSSLGFEYTYE